MSKSRCIRLHMELKRQTRVTWERFIRRLHFVTHFAHFMFAFPPIDWMWLWLVSKQIQSSVSDLFLLRKSRKCLHSPTFQLSTQYGYVYILWFGQFHKILPLQDVLIALLSFPLLVFLHCWRQSTKGLHSNYHL